MLERATRICEAQFGNLFLRDGDEDRADVVTGGRRNPVINLPQNPGIPIDRVVRTGQVSQDRKIGMEVASPVLNDGGENLMPIRGTNRRVFIAGLGGAAAWPVVRQKAIHR
jgi:hypothetical protein